MPLSLLDRLELYSVITPGQRDELLFATVYNDLRIVVDDPVTRQEQALRMLGSFREGHKDLVDRLARGVQISREGWREAIVMASERLLAVPGYKPYERSVLLNLWLTRAGLCPLVHYAFDRWFEIGSYGRAVSVDVVDDLVDLSTTFLFRLVPIHQAPTPLTRIGSGAYTHVYRSLDGASIFKVPRNLASRAFAAHDEHVASEFAVSSALADFVPRHLGFDPATSVIQREFIAGPGGVDLLTRAEFREAPFGLEQLEQLYTAACGIFRGHGINFDIHPGNIRWCEDRERWMLVDLGPMPTIGADYFPRDGFSKYFQKVWLDLHHLMATVPIRSLDIEVPQRKAA